jgi:metal-responsive CopG/Arc/MetJ family transcriptional regulator
LKTKIDIVLEEDVAQKLKERAAKEGKPINEIIEEVLSWYLTKGSNQQKLRESAVAHLCSRPFNLSTKEMQEILEEDYYEQ